MSSNPKIIVTGSAGFIGSNLMSLLISNNSEVLGIDSFSTYYSVKMKTIRLEHFGLRNYTVNSDINNKNDLLRIFQDFEPDIVIHLAAQGGVRSSRKYPRPYLESNQTGFLNVLEASSQLKVRHFIFASSSSAYGNNKSAPFKEESKLAFPTSLYALSKISNELIAKNFSGTDISITGLRFFTVYGPWNRPDMAIFRLIASSILKQPFQLSASLEVMRDFTYVDDVSRVILGLIQSEFPRNKFEIFNVAGGKPYSLKNVLQILKNCGYDTIIEKISNDQSDVNITHGSTEKLIRYKLPVPKTSLEDGLSKTFEWIENIDIQDIDAWFNYSKNV